MSKLALKTETLRTLVSSELDAVFGGLAVPTSSAEHGGKVSSAIKPTSSAVSSAHKPPHQTVSSVFNPTATAVSSARPGHSVSSALNPTATAVSSARG